MKFPKMEKIPYQVPEPDEYFDQYFVSPDRVPSPAARTRTDSIPQRRTSKTGKKKQTAPLQALPSGESYDDGGLSKFDYRGTAETNERAVVTRQRALHDTFFDNGVAGAAMLKKLTKRVDEPLADPDVLEALGWLMRLETKNPGLRLLGINRRVLACIAVFYRDTGGKNWAPLKWPCTDSESNEKFLGGLEVNPVGTVTHLALPENNLVGVIPRDFTKGVQNLKELDLHGNPGLGGGLPGTIGNLPLCIRLDLSFCGFEGPLPPQLCLMVQLKELNLNNCAFTGGERYVKLYLFGHVLLCFDFFFSLHLCFVVILIILVVVRAEPPPRRLQQTSALEPLKQQLCRHPSSLVGSP
jgi:hypothetical protein